MNFTSVGFRLTTGDVVSLVVWRLAAMRLRSVTARQWLYLVASWLFYFTWGSWLIVVLLFSSLMNYALGRVAEKANHRRAAVDWHHFQSGAAERFQISALAWHGRAVRFAAVAAQTNDFPAGVSFWTFQALSYLLELYREEDLNPTLLEFCLYMSFWPTVLQGPICRMSSMLPQFRQEWAVTETICRPAYAGLRLAS